MILAIGIDAVDIYRFKDWHTKPYTSLQRIFSEEEIVYCIQNMHKSAERFALRFAIREATYKIMTVIGPQHSIPFLTLCKAVVIHKDSRGTPHIIIHWEILKNYTALYAQQAHIQWHLSCTHTDTSAIAYIIAETKCQDEPD